MTCLAHINQGAITDPSTETKNRTAGHKKAEAKAPAFRLAAQKGATNIYNTRLIENLRYNASTNGAAAFTDSEA